MLNLVFKGPVLQIQSIVAPDLTVSELYTLYSENLFPLPKRNSVGYTHKVPHSFHWTTNFYLTTTEGSSPKLHPFRHGELLKASTKESNPPPFPFSCHAVRFQWTRFVASSIVHLIECLAVIFICSPVSVVNECTGFFQFISLRPYLRL
jgi:hypothetical protein